MSALLDPMRRIARDLVDSKLWPIAALLLVAIVALPLLAGSSSDDAPAPAGPVAATTPGAPGSKSLITVVDETAGGKDDRAGTIGDPFYDPPAPAATGPAARPASGAAPSSDGPAGGGAASGDEPAASTPSRTVTSRRTAAPAPSGAQSVHYRTAVRWYATERSRPRAVSRLTPFGGGELLYLGVTRSDAVYAVFLLGSDATSQGDARCEDDDEDCRIIGLKAGDKQVVTVSPAGGEPRTYHLEVAFVRAVTTDAAEARRMRATVHPEGRAAMREMWQDARTAAALGPLRYDGKSGLLYRVRASEKPSK